MALSPAGKAAEKAEKAEKAATEARSISDSASPLMSLIFVRCIILEHIEDKELIARTASAEVHTETASGGAGSPGNR